MQKISVDEIIEKIREEADVRKREGPRFYKQDVPKEQIVKPITQETTVFRIIKIIQAKARKYPFYKLLYNTAYKFKSLITEYQDCIQLGEFIKYHDEEFVANAYRGILKREPDNPGFDHYLAKLRQGQLDKIDILGRLRYSKEGKQKKVEIRGLLIRFMLRSGYRIPVIGYIFNLLVSIIRLPSVLRNVQEYEAFTSARFTHHTVRVGGLALDTHNLSVGMNKTSNELKDLSKVVNKTSTELNDLSKIVNKTSNDLQFVSVDVYKTMKELHELSLDLNKTSKELSDLLTNKAEKTSVTMLSHRVRDQKINILELQNSLRLLFDELRQGQFEPLSIDQLNNIANEEKHLLDALYVAFEERFRGRKEDIKERTKVYLPYIKEAKVRTRDTSVLDIGCGRGEWLELLSEQGYSAKGIDSNRVMVQLCREEGCDAIEADALYYLRQLTPSTVTAITGLHLIEHLPITVLIQLLDEAFRVLRSGGVVIFETPNAESLLVGARTFYLDPTHRNPILPDTLKFLLEERGFVLKDILRLHKTDIEIEDKFLQELLFGSQDYGVVGVKP